MEVNANLGNGQSEHHAHSCPCCEALCPPPVSFCPGPCHSVHTQGLICSAVTPQRARRCLRQWEACWWGQIFPRYGTRAAHMCPWAAWWHGYHSPPWCTVALDNVVVHMPAHHRCATPLVSRCGFAVIHHLLCEQRCPLLHAFMLSSVHILVKSRNECI